MMGFSWGPTRPTARSPHSSGHVLHELHLVQAVEQKTTLPWQVVRQRDACQDLEHCSPRLKGEPGFLKSHMVVAAE